MKLTYKKGGTMGGCYKCGGKMYGAKGMKMGACYKCGGKMNAANGMIMDDDPTKPFHPINNPDGYAPFNILAPQTSVVENTANNIKVLPTPGELAYNASMANRSYLSATKSNQKSSSATKPIAKSDMQRIVKEEQEKMVGNLYGNPASGAVNSLGVIGENYLAENPDVALALGLAAYSGGTSLAGLGGRAAVKAGLNALKTFGVKSAKNYLLNPYVQATALAMGLPETVKGITGPNQKYNYSKDNLTAPSEYDRASIMTLLGYASGFGRLFPNRLVRNLSNITSGAVQGSGVYDMYQGNYGQGFSQLLAPGIGSIGGKALISGISKIPKGKPGSFWNKITTGTKEMTGFSGNAPIGYNKSTGSFTSMGTGRANRMNKTVKPMESLRGFNLSNIFPSAYLFNPKSWKPTGISSKVDLNKVIRERQEVNILNNKLKSAIKSGDNRGAMKLVKDFQNQKDPKTFLGKVQKEYKGLYEYTPPKLNFGQNIAYNMRTKPISTTAKGLGLLGASAIAGDYILNDSEFMNKLRNTAKSTLNK